MAARRSMLAVCALLVAAPCLAEEAPASRDVAALEGAIREAAKPIESREWSARHPSDAVERPGEDESSCLRARGEGQLSDGRVWTRTATFMRLPKREPPVPHRNPDGRCWLAAVAIEGPIELRGALTRALEKALPGRPGGVAGLVTAGAAGVVLHVSVPAPRAALTRFDSWTDLYSSGGELVLSQRATRRAVVRVAASIRGVRDIDETARRRMLALVEDHDYWEHPPRGREVVEAFGAWNQALGKLPPSRRVDALLTADEAMGFVTSHGGGPDDDDALAGDAERDPTRRIAGTDFVWNKLGGGYTYAHGFLRAALEGAPDTASRDRALERAMATGFDWSGKCDAGDEEWPRVLETGRQLLRRVSDPEARARIHFMMADAHATVVALARGAGNEYANADAYRGGENAALTSAIAHYREGLALDASSDGARAAWEALSYLAAGARVFPTGYLYFCVYD